MREKQMRKFKLITFIILMFIFSSCSIDKKIKDEYFSEKTLLKYQLENLPKGKWKDCVVWGDSFYFNIEKDDFKTWIISVIDYIDNREDITCWGSSERFKNSGTLDFPVIQFQNAEEYITKYTWLSIAFTTLPLKDNTFQNCYCIYAYSGYDETLDVKGENYHYDYYMNLQDSSSYANKYHITI